MNSSDAGSSVLNTFIGKVETQIINPAIELLGLAAFVLFVWGVVQYIRNSANEEKRVQGQQHIIWGIVGMVVIFGAFAIVNIMKNIVSVI